MTTTAAAPSLVCDELPAVTVPLRVKRRPQLRERLGRRVAPRPFVDGERDVVIARPAAVRRRRRLTVTGTISSANRPASIAAIARWWLRSANASCSSREMRDSRAWFSATRPVLR